MKHMKSKLMASMAMLLVSAVMLTSASFAWFTISTAPEIASVTTNIAANGNLEIALDAGQKQVPAASTTADAGKNETWGNLVDLKTFFDEANITLRPVDVTDAGVVSIPEFGLDGRISKLDPITAVQAADSTTTANFTDYGGVWLYNKNSVTWAFRVDFWLRSNVAGNVTLAGTGDRGASEAGAGSSLGNDLITVAFQTYGESANTAGTSAGAAGTLVNFTDEAGTNNLDVSETVVSLTANSPKMVSMYVYLDGAEITNAEMLTTTISDVLLNIQFKHSGTLTDLGIDGTGYGKTTTTP